ncbi:hypothetical protein SH661x_004013 [Planctomicrobium sp. SH661]|uniref:hypothetical protein n=1 Tax=Planctomicrobium sp. SH661 TaxID=3448124 RepID=UPI003F5C941A
MAHTSRISEYEQQPANGAHTAQQWCSEMVEAQPLASLCAVFAAGFVVGVGAVAAMATPSRPQSRLPQMDHLTDRIADAVSRAMPKQLSDLWSR